MTGIDNTFVRGTKRKTNQILWKLSIQTGATVLYSTVPTAFHMFTCVYVLKSNM